MKTFNSNALFLCIVAFAGYAGILAAEEITLDAPVEVTPGIKGAVELTFATQVNDFYQIQISEDLEQWDNEGYSIKGTGGQMSQLVSTRNLAKAFYRLRDDGDPANLAPSVPPGTIMAYAGFNPPSGWLLCDGSVYSTDFAPALHQVIANIFSTGSEGAGNFRVPNLNGRTLIGRGRATANDEIQPPTNWILGQNYGTERNTLKAENLPTHAHTIPRGTTAGSGSAVVRASSANTSALTTSATGGDVPINIMQPSIVITYIIKM